ncbi:MAG: ABC transporter ATP-binding protein [Herpetosiphonaceae bacterium]|nr:ABC transporter ATP-binding protein [Herpetosiphonaceae bacterium]
MLAFETYEVEPVVAPPLADRREIALVIDSVVKAFSDESRMPWSKKPKKPPVRAVDDISVEIGKGEIFGLLGANGSGKSTLIRLISTLLIPDAGQVSVFGYDVQADEKQVKRLINRVSVEASFFKKLSAAENLMYGARLYGLDVRDAKLRALDILKQLGLSEKRFYEPLEHMSRGMQQKVAIARGLLTSPVLLLLDEPTTGLDPRSKKDVQEFILRMRQEHQTTVFLTTHDMDEADHLCDRIAVIDAGRIVAMDTPAGLKSHLARERGVAEVSMEDVFLSLTGRSLDEDIEGMEEDDD